MVEIVNAEYIFFTNMVWMIYIEMYPMDREAWQAQGCTELGTTEVTEYVYHI